MRKALCAIGFGVAFGVPALIPGTAAATPFTQTADNGCAYISKSQLLSGANEITGGFLKLCDAKSTLRIHVFGPSGTGIDRTGEAGAGLVFQTKVKGSFCVEALDAAGRSHRGAKPACIDI